MQYIDLENFLSAHKKATMGTCIVVNASEDNKLLAGGKHYLGRIRKATVWTNIKLGMSYGGGVNAKLDNGEKFIPAPRKGFEWFGVGYPYTERSIKKQEIYLTLNYRNSDVKTECHSFYLLDGKVATEEEIKEFKKYYSGSSSSSKKQSEAGIADADQTRVVRYKVEDILYLGYDSDTAKETFEAEKIY